MVETPPCVCEGPLCGLVLGPLACGEKTMKCGELGVTLHCTSLVVFSLGKLLARLQQLEQKISIASISVTYAYQYL